MKRAISITCLTLEHNFYDGINYNNVDREKEIEKSQTKINNIGDTIANN